MKRAKKQQYINSVGYFIKVHTCRLISYLGLHSQKGDCFDPHMHFIICDFSVNVWTGMFPTLFIQYTG